MAPIQVVLLTQPECAFCDDAKSKLERLAEAYDIAIETVDLGSAQGAALAARTGLLFPPGVLLDGDPFSYGRLSERKLRLELERRSAQH